uniref:Uncharacterized protein n=1 Tax=viral metagenome TaxID=1070528 RepID=A0A6M3LI37_9ZZZZ
MPAEKTRKHWWETSTGRPVWEVRRNWGATACFVAVVIAASPTAPILAIGALSITTNSVAAGLGFLGTYVFGWGKGKAEERDKK